MYKSNNTNNSVLLNDALSFKQIIGNKLTLVSNTYMKQFIGTIYNNFIELADFPNLKHTHNNIYKLLTSPNMILFTVSKNNIMIAYCLGELMKLSDGRYVLFLSYLYVGSKYRRNGLGSILMNKIISYARFKRMNAVMLVCNTDDQRVMNFYFDKGFMYDQYLRRYDKYDVLTLNL
jgi:GNAT superfamily N-acetyltransferase